MPRKNEGSPLIAVSTSVNRSCSELITGLQNRSAWNAGEIMSDRFRDK